MGGVSVTRYRVQTTLEGGPTKLVSHNRGESPPNQAVAYNSHLHVGDIL